MLDIINRLEIDDAIIGVKILRFDLLKYTIDILIIIEKR